LPIQEPDLDLPLAGTPASRFLTWALAALVGASVLAFAIAAGANATVRQLTSEPRLVTAALPAAPAGMAGELETVQVLALLKTTPGVAFAAVVAPAELEELIEPWLGTREGQPPLPMPRLIDVGFDPGLEPDLANLEESLRAIVPEARIEDTAPGPAPGELAARTARLLAGSAALALLAAILVVVAVVTRLSLDLHAETVDLLRLMGAADRYVARQFEQHALASGLRGALVGFGAGLVLVLGFILLAGLAPSLGLPPLPLRTVDWVLLASLPVLGALLTMLAARLAAGYGLARMR
jgi:cell division transport system permease protein